MYKHIINKKETFIITYAYLNGKKIAL